MHTFHLKLYGINWPLPQVLIGLVHGGLENACDCCVMGNSFTNAWRLHAPVLLLLVLPQKSNMSQDISWILNPESWSLESWLWINKQTKHCIQFYFFHMKIFFTKFDYLKQRQVIRLRSVFKKPTIGPTMPASWGYYIQCTIAESWRSWKTLLLFDLQLSF